MTIQITNKHLKTVHNICKRVSNKSGVDVEDLYSECMSKLPLIVKNFDASLGKPFAAYMAISVRGYALNFCRDRSFLSVVKRSHLYLYTQSKKFNNLRQASNSLMVPVELLQQIHLQIKNSRRYSSIDVSDEWKIPVEEYTTNSNNARVLLTEIIDEVEYNLLEDVYINEVDEDTLIDTYGQQYEEDLQVILSKLEEHKELLLELIA